MFYCHPSLISNIFFYLPLSRANTSLMYAILPFYRLLVAAAFRVAVCVFFLSVLVLF